MQIINHLNTTLTTCQRFFIEKSIELLYIGSIDSYRVRLNNPKTILEELKYCLEEFEIGRIKHFQTIKAKDKDSKALVDEAIMLLDYEPSYLAYNTISKSYIKQLLTTINEHNYKKVISSIEILLNENQDYLNTALTGLEQLIDSNVSDFSELEKIDKTLNILFSELISKGFSKGFLYKICYGIFIKSLVPNNIFKTHFNNFKDRIIDVKNEYKVIFRIDTTKQVFEAISTFSHDILSLSDNIDDIKLENWRQKKLDAFNVPINARKFVSCNIKALDYFSALKKARNVLSEYLDVINLGLSGETLQIHNIALVIDLRSPEKGDFQNNTNILDGKYKVEKEHYLDFTKKLPSIINNVDVLNETKEKIKSAIRYLRLGNQSTEVEHKFINYWIGLEYLFSNYESQSTINRIKDHFIAAHSLAYVLRNLYSFKKAFSQLSLQNQALVPSYNNTNNDFLKTDVFFIEVETQFINIHPILAYRAMKLKQWLFDPKKVPNGTKYITHHKENLEIHFTRIYRLRNEIIHDAATDTNNEQIASNLRYYLTFILNELIDFLSKQQKKNLSIEDYFILNEIKLGNIAQQGYLVNDLLNVDCSIDFIS
ncbi:MAG: hypothetical protein RL308_1076 [Bacteroidota bacterium]|jgi:hypothetical protein